MLLRSTSVSPPQARRWSLDPGVKGFLFAFIGSQKSLAEQKQRARWTPNIAKSGDMEHSRNENSPG